MTTSPSYRPHGTDQRGRRFGSLVLAYVWQCAQPIAGYPPEVWRRDSCGNAIRWLDYGNTDSPYGWEVDHIYPVARGGTDDLTNLHVLQWHLNRTKGDSYPWSCPA